MVNGNNEIPTQKQKSKIFSPPPGFDHGPLELEDSVLRMSYETPFLINKMTKQENLKNNCFDVMLSNFISFKKISLKQDLQHLHQNPDRVDHHPLLHPAAFLLNLEAFLLLHHLLV